MTAEASRQKQKAEDPQGYIPSGSESAATRFSATPPDAANMAALLKSMMERMERSERRTAAALDEMQARLSAMTKEAESGVSAAERAEQVRRAQEKALALSKSGNEPENRPLYDSAFARLEERLSQLQSPSASMTAAKKAEITAPASDAIEVASAAAVKAVATGAAKQPGSDTGAYCARPAADARPEQAFVKTLETPPSPESTAAAPSPMRKYTENDSKAASSASRGEPPIIIQREADRPGATAASSAPDRGEVRFDDRFEALARRLEGALGASAGSDLKSLSAKLDAISRELKGAFAEPANALTTKLDGMEQRLSKLFAVIEETSKHLDRLATEAASRASTAGGNARSDPLAKRLDSMHAEMTAFDGRARAQSERLAAAIDGLQHLLKDVAAHGTAAKDASTVAPSTASAISSGAASTAQFAARKPANNAGVLSGQLSPEAKAAESGLSSHAGAADAAKGERQDSGSFTASLGERLSSIRQSESEANKLRSDASASQAGTESASSQPAKDDFVAAARRAAQAAAARVNEKLAVAHTQHGTTASANRSRASDAQSSRPRPLLVIAAAVLLIASAALLYSRLESKTETEAPQVEQSSPDRMEETPDGAEKSSSTNRESGPAMVARNSSSSNPESVTAKLKTASILPADAKLTNRNTDSVVVKSVGDDSTALDGQVQLPPAMIGPYSLRLGAARGDVHAAFEVALRFAQGENVPQNWGEAARWYGRAAAKGFAPAQYRLAILYDRGQGVDKDPARARIWYTRAAEQGNVKAMHNLGVLISGKDAKTEDYVRAAQWFAKAAEHGLADSQFNLAIFFENGLGVQKNISEAYKWYSLAANQMDVEAANRRDALKGQLDPDKLAAADKAVKAWRPAEQNQQANAPDSGQWNTTVSDLETR